MYAIIVTGGKQYKVEEGQKTIFVESLTLSKVTRLLLIR